MDTIVSGKYRLIKTGSPDAYQEAAASRMVPSRRLLVLDDPVSLNVL
ncbi:MAG: hypothetical protein KIS83_13635 [Rubrivivax sp.]|nr:hypothetical protein [Rubrivivax sp.]